MIIVVEWAVKRQYKQIIPHAEDHQYTKILDHSKLISIRKQQDNSERYWSSVQTQHGLGLVWLLMCIKEKIITY